MHDRINVHLVTKWEGRYGVEAKPNFHSQIIFSKNLVALELRKLEVKFEKPMYVDICILDIFKTYLYEFYHEYMVHALFHEKCKIMYTDNLIYHVECEEVYDNIKITYK